MSSLSSFLSPASTSLKICGITRHEDMLKLRDIAVDAVGLNFWGKSKRFLPEFERAWLKEFSGTLLRVGVFVNAEPEFALSLLENDFIDVIQLHGDESVADTQIYRDAGVPWFKALGVKTASDFAHAANYGAHAILLDTHAPAVYGGTGEAFDWTLAQLFMKQFPQLPLILAGGITPLNAVEAIASVHPAALDIASGAEIALGVKDFEKVRALFAATHPTL